MKFYAVALCAAGSLLATSAWAGGARTAPVQRVEVIPAPAAITRTVVVEKIVERTVPGPERIVEHVVEKPVERIVERRVEVPGPERIVERVVERPVEKIVYVDRVVERVAGQREQRRPAK